MKAAVLALVRAVAAPVGASFAAVRVTPRLTTAGNVAPVGPFQSKKAASSPTTSATALGVAGWGVRMR